MKTGRREKRCGADLPRAKAIAPPCRTCPKGPKPYENELIPENWQALEYAELCAVDNTGVLPRDLTVIRNNAIVRRVREAHERTQLSSTLLGLLPLLRR